MSADSITAYPLTPTQQGMLFHHLSMAGRGHDIERIQCTLRETLDADRLQAAWGWLRLRILIEIAIAAMDRAGYDGAERWQASLNIHVVLRSQGRLTEAAERLAEARRAASTASDESALPFLENAEGQWLMADGRVEEAIDHLTLALPTPSSSSNEPCR